MKILKETTKIRQICYLLFSLMAASSVIRLSRQTLRSIDQIGAKSAPSDIKRFVYAMLGSGLCSQILNFAAQAVYLGELEHRQIMVDESVYPEHRRSEDIGVLTGFFAPRFTVFDRNVEGHEAIEQLSPGFEYSHIRYQVGQREVVWDPLLDHDKPLYVTFLFSMRDEIMQYFDIKRAWKYNWLPAFFTGSKQYYNKMARFLCPNFQFNEQTRAEIAQYKQENGIPQLQDGETSIAFHIRRGDKIQGSAGCKRPETLRGHWDRWQNIIHPRGESRCWSADSYVQKFLKVSTTGKEVNYCFIASDDYRAVVEIRDSLRKHKVQCQVHSLVQPDQRGNGVSRSEKLQGKESIHFFSELSMMIGADYFVGTLNSNVGLFISAMRSCDATDRTHFARSYGVDRETFYLP